MLVLVLVLVLVLERMAGGWVRPLAKLAREIVNIAPLEIVRL